VSRALLELGFEVLVANPRALRSIYQSTRKNDPRDAEQLARLGRSDPELLYPIRHRRQEAQRDLHVLKARDVLVRTRTKLINHVRATIKSFGARLPRVHPESFHKRALEFVPAELVASIQPILATLEAIDAQVKELDGQIAHLCKEVYPETELLEQVVGVGHVTALGFVLTIDDPHRFERSRDVPAFLGLVPKQDKSGTIDRALPISKAGDRFLRRLLVQAANYILGPFGPDTDLRRWGEAIADRGGKAQRKRARVAVARKLSVLLHRLWVSAEVYEPNRATEHAA
jgi:transposase